MKATWIPGLPVATLLIAVVAASLPLWTCSLCGALVRRLQGTPSRAYTTNCPRCRDSGRAALWPRRRLDSLPRELFENPPITTGDKSSRLPHPPGFERALVRLLDRQGAAPPRLSGGVFGEARFDICDGEDVVLVLLYGSSPTGCARVEAWMLDLDGTLKDHFDTVTSPHDGSVCYQFAEGGGLRLFRDSGFTRDGPRTITLRRDGRPPWSAEAAFGVRLAGGRFVPD
ncbi:MAG TPA: hypothetical protein VF950_01360 [Planctomycetota bacterium]